MLRILHYIIVQASRHSTAPPRVCVVSTIHPSLIFVCARNTNGIVCVAHNNKNTRRRIHLSLTHSHSVSGWLSVKYTVHINIHTDTSKERVISKQEHFWGRTFFFRTFVRFHTSCIEYMQYSAVATAAATTAILPNFFLSLLLLIGLCVCIFWFGVSSRSSSLRYSWRVLFSFAKPVLIYVFRRTSFALRLIKYVYGIVNDNNFSRFIVNDQWATYLWVHINKREIRPNFIFNTVYLDGRR